ncbi:hypothetical protein [Anaerococcus prevotii]|uniref:hypothetical protein n=1 Tax=Anaerococcus prevotii TaxID=33034 RepID=UPI00019DD3F0|nr:hypothetical protein [Anaerococcus prevotii]
MGIFSTREISILIWLTIIISLILIKKETRIAFIDCIKLLFEPKIAIIWFIYCLYIFLITILLTNLSIWKRIYIKDIIIWTILVGMINYFKSITDNDSVFSLRKLIKDNINVTIIVEFIISIFTFDIILELIIAPIATILSLLSLYIERNSNYENVYKIIDGIMGAFGLFLAFKTIGVGIYEYKYLNIKDTLVSFMIPIIYSFLSITLYYIIRLYVRYEVVFVSLPFSRVINSKIKKRRFYKIFKVCRFSIEKLEYFYKNYVPYMYESMSEEEFDDVLKSFILECQSTYLETSNEK